MFRLENSMRNAQKIANEAIRSDVASLIEFYGSAAFNEACERARRARVRGDRTERLIWTEVALKVRHRNLGGLPKLLVQPGSEPAEACKPRPTPKGKRRRSSAKQETTSRSDAECGSLKLRPVSS